MASEGGGKIKSKRGNSTSKPYERRKSLFRRITDSIKDVLRPSWLPNDDNGDPSTSGRPGTSSGDDGEEQFLSPPQSPSQLLGHNSQGLRPSERLYPQLPHPDSSHAPGNAAVAWQQGASGWQGQGQGTRSSTWGNNANAFDKSQFTPNYFGQKHMAGARQAGSMPEIAPSPRGLGGPAPITPSASSSTPTGHRRLVVPQSGVSSSSQRDDGQGRASAGPSFPPSASPSLNSEDNPTKRQRLWSPEVLRRGTSLSATQQRLWSPERKGSLLQPAVKDKPAFKISVFSSPSLNESSHESSFYSGRTTYGGASAYSRQSFNSSLPYQNSLPLRKSVKAKPLNNSGNAVLSSSATQILKTLERLSDAKRSRANDTESESLLSFTPSSYRKASRPLQTSLPSRSLELPVRGPPTHQLNTPVAASIAKNRQIISLPARRPNPPAASATCSKQDDRRQDVAHMDEGDEDVRVVRVEEKPAQARTTTTSSSAVSEGPSSSRSSGKMKHPKSYDTRPKAAREEDEVVEIPNLRTDFTLPISAAGFSLGLPTAPPPSYSSSYSSSTFSATYASTPFRSSGHSVATKTSTSMSIQSPPSVNAHFTFSSPIQKSAPGRSGFSPASTEDFQFSSPLKVSDSIQASSYKSAMTSTIGSSPMSSQSGFTPAAWGSTAPKPKSSFTGNAQASPVTSSYGGIMSPSSSSDRPVMATPELKFGSVMDILGGGNKSPAKCSPSGSGFQPASQLKQGSVMDILGGKSTTTAASTLSGSGSTGGDSLFAKFTAPAGTWDCDACMLQNKPDAAKCVACETPKPGTKQSAPFTASGSGSTSGDSLFAKFTAPAGTWDCDACMLQNKPDAAKCVACETPKPGSAPAKPSAPASDLMAKFRPPQGSWECDVCMVQNTGGDTKCLACETPRPGTQATGSVPAPAAPAPAPGVVGPSGGLILSSIPTSSSGASPFLSAGTSGTESSSTGFKFGAPPSSSSLPAAGGFMFGASSSSAAKAFGATSKDSSGTAGFKFGTGAAGTTDSSTEKSKFETSSTGAKDTSGTAGFQFGSKDTSNSNSASSTAGFQFGAKDSTDANGPLTSAGSAVKLGAGADSKLTSSTATGSGFQFGAPLAPSGGSGFVFGAPSKTSPAQDSASSTSASALPGGFSFKTPSEAGGAQTQGKDSSAKSIDKLTSPQETGNEGNAHSLFTPVFGVGKPSNNFSMGAAPSLATGEANSVTGGFSFGATASRDSAAPSVFGSGLTSKVTFSGSDDSKAESRDSSAKAPSLSGGFSFAAAAKTNNDTSAKPGLFSSLAPDSSSKNGPSSSVAAPASSGSAGFAFGGNATTASPFGSGAQLGAGGFGSAPSAAKPVVNGEVAAPGMFAFGQQTSTSTAGFSFATPAANKDGVGNAPAPAKLPFAFGGADSGKSSGKRRLDNDLGPGEAKKSLFSMTGAPSLGEGEPFKFSNTAPAAGGSGMFKFGQRSDGPAEKAPNITAFGGQASGFGSAGTPGGFSFSNPQTNAASSTGAPAPSLFGAGTGSTNTGQFSFSVGAGSQSNAAAASPFGSGASAPLASSQGAGGFNFAGATQPSFNFGATNTAAPVFAFGVPSGEPAPAQPAPSGGVFAFGQTAPSADSTSSFSAPGPNPAPNAMGFGAAPAQTNFNIGTSSEARKIKRAVRRAVRK